MPTGVAGKFFLSLFFLVFLGMGLLFVWFTAREAAQIYQAWTWKKTDCEIIASTVRETDDEGRRTGEFFLDVEYRYRFNAEAFTSHKHKQKPGSFSDYAKAARVAGQYRPGSSAVCYVNPSVPSEAILQQGSLLTPLIVLFPMIFVAIGAGGIHFTWRRKPAGKDPAAQPISDRASSGKGQRFASLFFAVFLLAGCVFLYFFLLSPLFKIMAAKSWPEVPCVVISSEVKSHDSDDGTTYSVNILYRYEFNEREFKSNRYGFMGGSSSGHAGKAEIVRRHPPGKQTFCYVNPADPTEAVLVRGFTPAMWFGAIPLVFVLVGAGGLIQSVRKRNAGGLVSGAMGRPITFGDQTSAANPVLPGAERAGTVLLKPKTAPWAKFLGAILIAAFWNGCISVFVLQAVKSWKSGDPEWFLTLFMIPFVLIGLVMIGAVGYCFLALFNPRPTLRMTPGAVPLGGQLQVDWEFSGRTHALQRVRIRLEGREEATYRRGTTTSTDRNVFARLELANVSARGEMRSGTRMVIIPAGLMHSFASDNNRIVWSLHAEGEIAMWPDVNEEFPLRVLPAAESARSNS